jgi:hypothetical protein
MDKITYIKQGKAVLVLRINATDKTNIDILSLCKYIYTELPSGRNR